MTIQRKRGFAAFAGALSVAALLNACGEDLEQITSSDKIKAVSYEELGECNKSNDGRLAYVKDSSAVYLCADSVWTEMYITEIDEVTGKNGSDGKDGSNGKNGTDGKNGKDGQNGANGTSCTVSALKDGSGYDVLCGGEKVGQLLSAKDGEKGDKGASSSEKGDKGDKGDKGVNGANCTTKALEDGSGYEISCNGKSVGTIKNGSNGEKGAAGASCSAKTLDDGSGFEISCGGKVVGTLKNGESHTGAGCTFEDDGEGLITTKCGSDTKGVKLYKAVCGTTPYDPNEYTCLGVLFTKDGNFRPAIAPLCNGEPYTPYDPKEDGLIARMTSSDSKQTCKDGVLYAECGDEEYNTETHFCAYENKKVYERCGGSNYYLESFSSCKDGVIYNKCGDGEYNSKTQFCAWQDKKVYDKCDGREFDITRYFCKNDSLYAYCGDESYNIKTHACVNNRNIYPLCGEYEEYGNPNYYNPEYELCIDGNTWRKCGDDKPYDPYKQVCEDGNVLLKCGNKGDGYDPETQICDENGKVLTKCGENGYDPATHFCGANNQITKLCGTDLKDYDIEKEVCKDGKVLTKCGEDGYDPATQFCGANNQIAKLCGTNLKDYDIEKEVCKDGKVLTKCGEDGYDPATHFCGANNQIAKLCGADLKDYDPETQKCDENGVVLTKCGSTYFDSKEEKCVNGYVKNRTFCGDKEYDVETHFCDKRDNHPYKKFLLYFAGKKPRYEYYWMAENLDHDMEEGSTQYLKTRYYRWDAAQDACPTGWHLPTKAEFENLISRTGGSEIAGKNLKSVDGWSKASNGTVALDSYGFGATASGYLYFLDWPQDTQTLGLYVSATDEGDSVYVLELHHDSDVAEIKLWPKKDKDGYFIKYPVRCMLRVQS